MRKSTKSTITAGLLAGSLLASAGLWAHEDGKTGHSMMEQESGGMMSEDSMMGNGSGNMMEMMGMMQKMNRMMDNCNKMMESHKEMESKSHEPGQSNG